MTLVCNLPIELENRIFYYAAEHPCASIIGNYHANAKFCDDKDCYAKRRLPHEKTFEADVTMDGNWSFSLNLCGECKPKIKRDIKQLNVDLMPFSDRCREREIRGWLYENYNLPDDIRVLFESMFEDDDETDFEHEEDNLEEEDEDSDEDSDED